jgi:hypothetical protein
VAPPNVELSGLRVSFAAGRDARFFVARFFFAAGRTFLTVTLRFLDVVFACAVTFGFRAAFFLFGAVFGFFTDFPRPLVLIEKYYAKRLVDARRVGGYRPAYAGLYGKRNCMPALITRRL